MTAPLLIALAIFSKIISLDSADATLRLNLLQAIGDRLSARGDFFGFSPRLLLLILLTVYSTLLKYVAIVGLKES